jgi:hypothetical protein
MIVRLPIVRLENFFTTEDAEDTEGNLAFLRSAVVKYFLPNESF